MKTDTIDLSVVIPVYNSRDCMRELLEQLTSMLDQLGKRYEVILIDDASPDNTWEVIQEELPQYPHVSAIQLMRNSGQAKATLCGLTNARGEIIVTMDDDLQHQPDQLKVLLETLEAHSEVDCVLGYFKEKKHAGYRNLGSKIMRWVNARAFGLPKSIHSSGFRVMRRNVAQAITNHRTHNLAICAELFNSTDRILSIPVKHVARYAGRSNYSLARQLRLALDNICNVSMLPLRAVSMMGFVVCFLSVLIGVRVFYLYFSGHTKVAGWTTVVILVLFFSGITLLSLGVIGEYMVRVLREVRGSPRFIERAKVGAAFDLPSDQPDGRAES